MVLSKKCEALVRNDMFHLHITGKMDILVYRALFDILDGHKTPLHAYTNLVEQETRGELSPTEAAAGRHLAQHLSKLPSFTPVAQLATPQSTHKPRR